jgi:hypothetical protein
MDGLTFDTERGVLASMKCLEEVPFALNTAKTGIAKRVKSIG